MRPAEGVTIHRGTAPGSVTSIGARCLLMSNSHVGHNCTLADDVILVSGSLLGGHVEIGRRAMISGNAAIHQFCRVGELALVGILARIVQDVPPFFLTDQGGNIIGENKVGMTHGLSPDERHEIKTAFRVIYRAGLGQSTRSTILPAPSRRKQGADCWRSWPATRTAGWPRVRPTPPAQRKPAASGMCAPRWQRSVLSDCKAPT